MHCSSGLRALEKSNGDYQTKWSKSLANTFRLSSGPTHTVPTVSYEIKQYCTCFSSVYHWFILSLVKTPRPWNCKGSHKTYTVTLYFILIVVYHWFIVERSSFLSPENNVICTVFTLTLTFSLAFTITISFSLTYPYLYPYPYLHVKWNYLSMMIDPNRRRDKKNRRQAEKSSLF